MSQQLQAALRLAQMGFRVFPLIPGDKKPAVSRFPIVATTDEKQIRIWWEARPSYNVGVSTTGFVVVDVDTKWGPHVLENFKNLGGDFNTFTVRTATGGYHCYYSGPDSRLAAGIVEGVDIRSHGGYVVGPGSVTSRANPGCVDGEYTVVNTASMAYVPGGIEVCLEMPRALMTRDDNAVLDEPVNIANAAVWLQAAEPAIEGKGGNAATYKVCAKLVRDFALSEETAYQQLITHWNDRCLPPWQPGELWKLVQHASAYGSGDLGAASPMAMFGQVKLIEPPQAQAVAVQSFAPVGVYMGNAITPDKQTARPWKVEKLLMNGEVTVIGGMGAMGKSMFQLCCAAHFALGKDFGPYKLKLPNVPLRSMIYNGEDDIMEASRRLLAICMHFNFDYYIVAASVVLMDDRQGELSIAHKLQGVYQMNQDAISYIVNTARANNVDILFFDPLVNLHMLDENSNGDMRFVMGILHGIARETNTALMVAHHTGKGSLAKEKGDVDAFRGAGAIINAARIGIVMSPIKQEDAEMFGIKPNNRSQYIRLDTAKANYLPPRAGEAQSWLMWNVIHHPAGDLIGVPAMADVKSRKSDQDKELATIIRDHMRVQGSGAIIRTEAARAIKESGHMLGTLSESRLLNIFKVMFSNPVRIDSDTLTIQTEGGKELIKLT